MEENKCLNCGKELKEKIQDFCSKCGKKLTYEEQRELLERDLNKTINSLHRFCF
jgi:DNA-directed RNA polymerase subunit RPC12/RpoP